MKIISSTTQIRYKPMSNGRKRLTSPFQLTFSLDGTTYILNIEAGFEWDGASIPSFLRWWKSKWAKCSLEGTLVHDALYLSHLLPRDLSDKLFVKLLTCGWFDKLLYSAGVNLFGWASYYFQSAEEAERAKLVGMEERPKEKSQ